ncbi:MAG: ATP-binding protein [Actinobacteria bacterium]|nr:ATP-binding protein [Actinomycetota bacterium]
MTPPPEAAGWSQDEDFTRALLNILDDFSEEKARAELTQRAMLNLLDDFDIERSKTEAANVDLREAFESLRRAKEAADVANREIEAFSYSVSHDLRAPLRSIDGFSLALLEDYADTLDDMGRDYLRRVRAATQRMGQLIDDLLMLSRLTRSQLNIEMVDLSSLALKIVDELTQSDLDRQAVFTVPDGIVARADASLMVVVMENLLGNAWKFTAKTIPASIEFGSMASERETVYFVRGSGAGFDMAYVDKLFGVFQRLHKEQEFPGQGVGLSLVQRVIHRLGGKVWAEGEVGKGAAFFFTLHPQD